MSEAWRYFICDCCGVRMSIPASVPPKCGMGHDAQRMREVEEAEYHGVSAGRDARRSED